MGRYQKGKTNLDFTEARDSEWHWHQLGHMICDNTFFLISLFKMRHVIFSLNECVMLCCVMVVFNSFAAPFVSGLFTLGWMCALKREQARRGSESELRHVNSLQTLL